MLMVAMKVFKPRGITPILSGIRLYEKINNLN